MPRTHVGAGYGLRARNEWPQSERTGCGHGSRQEFATRRPAARARYGTRARKRVDEVFELRRRASNSRLTPDDRARRINEEHGPFVSDSVSSANRARRIEARKEGNRE
jgi:hypothetical protein